MTLPDIINGMFEICGGLFVLNHCRILYRDKLVREVSVVSTVFFQSWGAWNIFFYSNLDQWASFYGGLVIFSANTLWIAMMVYYLREKPSVQA